MWTATPFFTLFTRPMAGVCMADVSLVLDQLDLEEALDSAKHQGIIQCYKKEKRQKLSEENE